MTRGRPYEFPDPKDRSVNDPHELVERERVLGLYNQANPNEQARNFSEKVRTWFEAEAARNGWHSVQFVGDAAVLEARVELK